MSDYFGALLRSAGAVPAGAGAVATPAGGDDLVEQAVEIVAGRTPDRASTADPNPMAAPSSIDPLAYSLDMPAAKAPIEPPTVLHSTPVPTTGGERAVFADEVHPAVAAALQWVAAEPVVAVRAAPLTTEAPAATDPLPQQAWPPAFIPPARTSPSRQAQRPTRTGHKTLPLQEPMIEAQSQTDWRSEREPSLPLRQVHGEPSQLGTGFDYAAIPAQDRVEVNIGAIHVTVDAPPAPRTIVPPAATRPPPQPARFTPRAGFSRSRLPRI